MSPKLKFTLICRCSDRGFALPVAIGLGFVFLLIAVTLVMRSQSDETTASTQKATARGLGTTETGITRVQSLLNRYGNLANVTLTNIGSPPTSSSWKQVYNTLPSVAAGCAAAAAGATEVDGYRLNQWKDLDDGQFKVNSYSYTPDSAQITANATIPANGAVTLSISPSDFLIDGGSVYGEISSVPGTLSRSGTTYTCTRLAAGADTSVSSPGSFVPNNTSAQITTSGSFGMSVAIIFGNSCPPKRTMRTGTRTTKRVKSLTRSVSTLRS
ncbi:MAG: hypothetical protein N4J56_001728 [Chroococcidiopsis sp. SAG 2025]|nr:hypothetical protein [Chroococcidiopsis sp. SAG 2025]